jgi:hypothetical protein
MRAAVRIAELEEHDASDVLNLGVESDTEIAQERHSGRHVGRPEEKARRPGRVESGPVGVECKARFASRGQIIDRCVVRGSASGSPSSVAYHRAERAMLRTGMKT